MFATEFDGLLDEEHKAINVIPENFIKTIDELNAWIYVGFTVQCMFLIHWGANIFIG